jgi:RHS repeat-associated protein
MLPGQYYDAETGLMYNMARDYDPAIGRYVESDPECKVGGSGAPAGVDSIDPRPLVEPRARHLE